MAIRSSCTDHRHDQVYEAVWGAKHQRTIRVNPLDDDARLPAKQSQWFDQVTGAQSDGNRLPLVRDFKLGSARRAVVALADEPQGTGIKVKLYARVGFVQDNGTLAHRRQERACVKLGAALDSLKKD